MAAMLLLISLSLVKLLPTLQEVPVERGEYPVSAMQYLHDQQLHGRTLVTFNWAQYAIGCFAADDGPLRESRVAVDGRFETCFPREITDICFDFWLGTDDPGDRYRSPYAPPFSPSLVLRCHPLLYFVCPLLIALCHLLVVLCSCPLVCSVHTLCGTLFSPSLVLHSRPLMCSVHNLCGSPFSPS